MIGIAGILADPSQLFLGFNQLLGNILLRLLQIFYVLSFVLFILSQFLDINNQLKFIAIASSLPGGLDEVDFDRGVLLIFLSPGSLAPFRIHGIINDRVGIGG